MRLHRLHAPRRRRIAGQLGFTLIELMVVVVIVAVLMTLAVVTIRGNSYGQSVFGYGEQINAELDNARIRAVATRRWQRLLVSRDTVIHSEATTPGMGTPADWNPLRTLYAPADIYVTSADDATHVTPGIDVPAAGDGLPVAIDLAPDGGGQAVTVFIAERSDHERARLAIYGATGASYVFADW